MQSKMAAGPTRSAFVLGYTGETGKALVKELSQQKYFKNVVLIGRRKVDLPEDINKDFVSAKYSGNWKPLSE